MARTKPAKTKGKTSRKLKLSKETLKELTARDARVKGGRVGCMSGATVCPVFCSK